MEYVKAPAAVLNYGRDWTTWLETGDAIVTSTWTADPDNPDTALIVAGAAHNGKIATIIVSGGTLGARYRVTNRVVTSNGLTDERSDYWAITER